MLQNAYACDQLVEVLIPLRSAQQMRHRHFELKQLGHDEDAASHTQALPITGSDREVVVED